MFTPAPYKPMKRNSVALAAAGITMLAVGGGGFFAGIAMFSAGSQYRAVFNCNAQGMCFEPTREQNTPLKNAGIAAMVLGGLAVGAGIPMMIIGLKKVPAKAGEETSLVPELHLGAAGGSLAWRL
jgi:hypothetical protein